jgi:hypothetical protein
MPPFWQSFCVGLRHHGRDATLFAVCLAAVAGVAPFWEQGGAWILLGAVLAVIGWIVSRLIAEYRDQLPGPAYHPQLSQNELHVVRSKLRQRQSNQIIKRSDS